MNCFPSERRLLLGIQAAIESFQGLCASAEGDSVASSANAVLNELVLRLDRPFYRDYLHTGLAILRDVPPELVGALPSADQAVLTQTAHRVQESLNTSEWNDFDQVSQAIEDLRASLATVCSSGDRLLPVDGPLIKRVIEWEGMLFARAMAHKPEKRAKLPTLTTDRLQDYLRVRFPAHRSVQVTGFKTLVGGFQKLTILFETHEPLLGSQSFVMRAEQPDRFAPLELGAVVDEFAVINVLRSMGLPVAEPLWLESDPTLLGRRFLVSRKAEGINYGAAVGVDKRMSEEIARAFVTTLVRIHRTPLNHYRRELSATRMKHWLEYESSSANAMAIVHYWKDLLKVRPHGASPTLELVFDWLIRNVPREPTPLCLLHCDYAPHNVLVHDDTISAVLDWELARVGDPAQDLAYFLQSTEGTVDRQQALQWYADAGGPQISSFRLRYFEVFSILQWLVGCISASSLYASDNDARNIWVIGSNWMELPLRLALPRLKAAMQEHEGVGAG
ncbi:MAG TPA: phosphotransferase family protein [Steroidobacteraceae bacterium]|nr:phosphotransferase family protein [Steroidobacteraceae bacterium]